MAFLAGEAGLLGACSGFSDTLLDDALRIAFTELVNWIHADYGLSEMDAYELLSKVARIHLAEMVDPNYVVIAGIEKRYLPKK